MKAYLISTTKMHFFKHNLCVGDNCLEDFRENKVGQNVNFELGH